MLRFLYSGKLGDLFAPTPEPIEIVFQAIYENLPEKVKEVIDTGFDANTKNSDNNSPLAAAAYYGRTNMIQMIIASGADVNLTCRGGNTALHFASKNGHVMAVELLLENGADKHCVNGTGLSALHVAAVYGYVCVFVCIYIFFPSPLHKQTKYVTHFILCFAVRVVVVGGDFSMGYCVSVIWRQLYLC